MRRDHLSAHRTLLLDYQRVFDAFRTEAMPARCGHHRATHRIPADRALRGFQCLGFRHAREPATHGKSRAERDRSRHGLVHNVVHTSRVYVKILKDVFLVCCHGRRRLSARCAGVRGAQARVTRRASRVLLSPRPSISLATHCQRRSAPWGPDGPTSGWLT